MSCLTSLWASTDIHFVLISVWFAGGDKVSQPVQLDWWWWDNESLLFFVLFFEQMLSFDFYHSKYQSSVMHEITNHCAYLFCLNSLTFFLLCKWEKKVVCTVLQVCSQLHYCSCTCEACSSSIVTTISFITFICWSAFNRYVNSLLQNRCLQALFHFAFYMNRMWLDFA